MTKERNKIKNIKLKPNNLPKILPSNTCATLNEKTQEKKRKKIKRIFPINHLLQIE